MTKARPKKLTLKRITVAKLGSVTGGEMATGLACNVDPGFIRRTK
jgi:hypothetical protein